MNSTDIVLKFLVFLGTIDSKFRKINIMAESMVELRDISTSVIPSKVIPSEYADEGVSISINLHAELVRPLEREKRGLGASLFVRHSLGYWIAEAEVGWSGTDIGWDPFDARECRTESIEELMHVGIQLTEWLSTRFEVAVADLRR